MSTLISTTSSNNPRLTLEIYGKTLVGQDRGEVDYHMLRRLFKISMFASGIASSSLEAV